MRNPEVGGFLFHCTAAPHRFRQFIPANIPDVGGYRPVMTEWIFKGAVTVTPKHVGHRHGNFCPGLLGFGDECVNVFDIEVNGDGRAIE